MRLQNCKMGVGNGSPDKDTVCACVYAYVCVCAYSCVRMCLHVCVHYAAINYVPHYPHDGLGCGNW